MSEVTDILSQIHEKLNDINTLVRVVKEDNKDFDETSNYRDLLVAAESGLMTLLLHLTKDEYIAMLFGLGTGSTTHENTCNELLLKCLNVREKSDLLLEKTTPKTIADYSNQIDDILNFVIVCEYWEGFKDDVRQLAAIVKTIKEGSNDLDTCKTYIAARESLSDRLYMQEPESNTHYRFDSTNLEDLKFRAREYLNTINWITYSKDNQNIKDLDEQDVDELGIMINNLYNVVAKIKTAGAPAVPVQGQDSVASTPGTVGGGGGGGRKAEEERVKAPSQPPMTPAAVKGQYSGASTPGTVGGGGGGGAEAAEAARAEVEAAEASEEKAEGRTSAGVGEGSGASLFSQPTSLEEEAEQSDKGAKGGVPKSGK